jgi:hypothetical protein
MQTNEMGLLSVEGQRREAARELKNDPFKMAVIIEADHPPTGKILYTYFIVKIAYLKIGQTYPFLIGWNATVKAVILPWHISNFPNTLNNQNYV